MAKIRHLAIISEDPERLADFYSKNFGMTVTGRSKGDVWVSDGYIDLALISKVNTPKPCGVNHFGIVLDPAEKEAVYANLRQSGHTPVNPRLADSSVDRPFVEDAVLDPDGNKFDLSTGKREMEEEQERMKVVRGGSTLLK